MSRFKPSSFINPIIEERSGLFFVEKEPPKGMDLDPTFGYESLESDPFPPCMLSDFDPNEIAKAFHINFSSYNQAILAPEKYILEKLNHDQRWIIGCNIMHALVRFIGEQMDERLKYNIGYAVGRTLAQLAQREVKPGVWDETY